MPRNAPSYRQRKNSDQAVVTLRDAHTKERRDYWLGPYELQESRERYHRLIAMWESAGRTLHPGADGPGVSPNRLTLEQLAGAYWTYVEGYYSSNEAYCIKLVLRLLRRFFGTTPAAEFGPVKLRLLRDQMIRGGIGSRRRDSTNAVVALAAVPDRNSKLLVLPRSEMAAYGRFMTTNVTFISCSWSS